MQAFIDKIKNKENLTQDEIQQVMREIMSGAAKELQIRDLLLALREKGPTVDEITGAAKIMRQFVVGVKTKHKTVLDTCGTGGDKKNTFNISTITAFVVAGAGVVVAKHGNRSVSSKCGSACVLEGLGINLNVEDKHLTECLDKIGIAFLFAQKLHPAMKNVAPVRKSLQVETIFNVLGPLTNPANATHQVMGVYSRDLVEPLAHVLKNLGLKRALVVHGSDGLDEITTTGKTFISEYDGKGIVSYDINPQELGLALAQPDDLAGGSLEENIQIFKDILDGQKGPKRDIVLLNAAYALYTAQKADNINECLKIAQDSIDTKKAKAKLEALIKLTNKYSFPRQ
ncbi:MAG: anthranilate phosphoribosyltransferase [Candidatus Omnitrophica bacterium]|nr:anthranilate phosphoribosyltransferase [Candidatus Omnitrophota bacterium]MCB9746912.1 anthranilate phosphoribosyltransferase [Candidatus Omnitrophota bacterium]